jgi:hypothetical protein
MPALTDRFALSADATQIIDRESGRRWDASAALRMFAKGVRKIAQDENLDPRGSQPQGGSAMPYGQYDQGEDPSNGGAGGSVQQAMQSVKQIMRALGPDARGPFISAFQAFLESDEDLDGPPDNNTEATDGRLRIVHGDRGRRGARDNRPTMRGGPGQAFDRAIDRRPFSERFPGAAKVNLGFGAFPGSN